MPKQIVDDQPPRLNGSGRLLSRRRVGIWLAGVIGGVAGGGWRLTTRPLYAAQSAGRGAGASSNSPRGTASSALDMLIAEKEIRDTIFLYARAVDDRKFELADQIFAPNVTGNFSPGGRREEIVALWKNLLGGCGPTQHLMGQMLINVNGSSRATSTTYIRAYHRGKGEKAKLFFWAMGEYQAEWERRPEGWRATHWSLRTFLNDGDRSVLGPT